MKMRHRLTLAATGIAMMAVTSACLKGETDDYEEWRKVNDDYIASIDTKEYELVVPDWAPQNSVYIKWHNDRSLTAGNLVPISNSTVDIKYELEDINGTRLDHSYGATTGDSVYRSQPNQNVLGMWIALTTMHVGDSATLIIPYPSGYGAATNGNVDKPYTNLIFHVKLKAIKDLVRPNN